MLPHDMTNLLRPVDGPAAWYRAEMVRSGEWLHELAADEIAEIDTGVETVLSRGIEISDITRDDFELPTLGPILERIRRDVIAGRGFVLIRGVPVDGRTRREKAIAYWGIGTYFGWAVPQNAQGHLLGHVRDIGMDPANPVHRLYATRARHLFHTDSCDIVGLFCLHGARSGGSSMIVSSVTIHNEMLERRPDLVEILGQPFHVDRKGEIPAGKKPHYQLPIFNHHAGYLTTIYARDFIEGAQRFADVPRLTPTQIEAMDMADELANSDELRLDMDFRPGDIQFLHNHQILHARTAYEDWPEPERKRHLLRLWLAPPDGRPLPPAFEERYGNIEPGTPRGGIRVPGQTLRAPLEPEQ
jgi:hypothetical protein